MDVIAIANKVREEASAAYQDRVPAATIQNLQDVGYIITDASNVMVANEFMNALLNKLVKSILHTKRFENPLKSLKKGKKPIGDSIEEIFVNFMKGETQDPDGKELLKRNLPDAKTVYHRMNYSVQYPITVDRKRLAKAFMSVESLETFISGVINTLYNSAELDEFVNMKQMIKAALDANAMKVVEITDPLTSETNSKEFIKTVKTVSGLMAFPSTEWNGYNQVQADDPKPITTFSRKDEQILILDTATDTTVAVDVLASTFNMSVAEFNDTRKIIIDAFPKCTAGTVRAALVDEAFFQIYDDFFAITEFYNGKGIYHNYYLNVDQTQAYSVLVNAVAFVVPEA